jgi:hypothetical protein
VNINLDKRISLACFLLKQNIFACAYHRFFFKADNKLIRIIISAALKFFLQRVISMKCRIIQVFE